MGDDPATHPTLEPVQEAVDRAEWSEARALLSAVEADVAEGPDGLRLTGLAAYGAGDFERAVTAFERQHALFVELGRPLQAARAAATVAMYLMMDTGLMAPVRAWLTRAERLLEDAGDENADEPVDQSPDRPGAGGQAAALVAIGPHLRTVPVWRPGRGRRVVTSRHRPGCGPRLRARGGTRPGRRGTRGHPGRRRRRWPGGPRRGRGGAAVGRTGPVDHRDGLV